MSAERSTDNNDMPSTSEGTHDEIQQFYTQFKTYPSLFHSAQTRIQNDSRLKSLLESLQGHKDSRDDEDEFMMFDANDTTLFNFHVFLLWSLRREEEAVEKAVQAVREHPASIVSHSNLAYIRWMRGERTAAKDEMKKLEKMKNGHEETFLTAEEQAVEEVVYCYSQMGLEFNNETIAVAEKAILKWPENQKIRFSLAIAMRRSLRLSYSSMQPGTDRVKAIHRAIDLFFELKNNENCKTTFRAWAAAELGHILFYNYDSDLDEAVRNKAQTLGLTALECYEEALRLDGNDPSVLCRAGRFFRFNRNFQRSVELLQRCVDLQANSKHFHQLGLTFKKMAKAEKSPNNPNASNVPTSFNKTKMLTLMMKSPINELFSRQDRYVAETMDAFTKAVDISHGDNTFALYDLGLMHKALTEYLDALEKFNGVLERNLFSQNVIGAFEQCGRMYQVLGQRSGREMAENKVTWSSRIMLKKTSHAMLIMALGCQCRLVLRGCQFRKHYSRIWQSFNTLKTHILKNYSTPSVEADTREDWLLILINRYSEDIEVLKDIFKFKNSESDSLQFLKDRFQKYMNAGRHEYAMLFLFLFKLTNQCSDESSLVDVDAELKMYVLAARQRLQEGSKDEDYLMNKLNAQAAKWMFCWAFEERFDSIACQQSSEHHQFESTTARDDQQDASDNNYVATACSVIHRKGHDLGSFSVFLVHDPRDSEVERDVTTMQTLLQATFGLHVDCAIPDVQNGIRSYAMETAMRCSSLVVVVVSDKGLSPDFERCLESALGTTNAPGTNALAPDLDSLSLSVTAEPAYRNVLVIRLKDAPIPSSLQRHRALMCPRADVFSDRSKEGIDAICNLVCQLLGIDNTFLQS